MEALNQLMITAVVAHKSLDEIIDDLYSEINKYKQAKISGGADPKKINFECFLFLTKMAMQEQCGDDVMKMMKLMERAEASRKIFETKDQ